MLHKRKKLVRVLMLLILVSAVILGWLFLLPLREKLILRVIPDDALLASRHIKPAQRLDTLVESAIVSNIVDRLGADGDDLRDAIQDSGTRWLVDTIGKKYFVTAYVPAIGVLPERFIMCGWIGFYSHLLRWGVFDKYLTDFSILKFKDGSKIWVYTDAGMQGYYISLSVYKGMLIGVISTKPAVVLKTLKRLRRPELSALAGRLLQQNSVYADVLEAGVKLPPVCGAGSIDLSGHISTVSASNLVADVAVDADKSGSTFIKQLGLGAGQVNNYRAMADVAGGVSSLMVGLPVATLDMLLALQGRVDPALKQFLRTYHNEQLIVFLGSEKYYGRLMHFKVPAVGVMLSLPKGRQSDGAIAGIVRIVNKLSGWDVVARRSTTNRNVFLLSAHRGPLKNMLKDERPAFGAGPGWLLLMSNRSALERVLANGDAVERNSGSVAYCWSHPFECEQSLRNALAVYTLAVRYGSGDRSVDTTDIKTAISLLELFKMFSLQLVPESDSHLQLEMRLEY